MAESSDFGLICCLQKLNDAEFQKFKDLLVNEPEFIPMPIPLNKIETASRKDLIKLLHTHYPGQVWDIVSMLFLQINRKDIWFMTQEMKRDERYTYKEVMRTTFRQIWYLETFIHMDDTNYQLSVEDEYWALERVFGHGEEPVTAIILGCKGEGKTTFLKKAMLDWASGNLWQNRFKYVFFFSLSSYNNSTELSLAQLMLSKLSESSESLDDILFDPKRILFILEGFDYLKFDLELRTNLCNDWRKMLPTQIVFSSLLQKVMLPESCLLLELGCLSIQKIYPLLQYPREITIGGFIDDLKKFYCMCFFTSYQKGLQVFNYLKTRQKLLTLCKSPYICWMFCSTLKWQCDRGEEMNLVSEPDSALYTSFMVSSFRSVYANCPCIQNRAKLKTLCILAVTSMWKQVFVFTSEDLRKNGISKSEEAVWLRMNFLHKQGDCFSFYHPALQSYFAALFYFLKQDKDRHHPIIGSLPKLLREVYAYGQTQWLLTGIFVFGIATETVASILQPHFGLLPCKEIREEILKCFKSLSQGEGGEKLVNPHSLFESILENQETSFVTQVMDLFEEMSVDIRDADELTLATYGLLKSQKLKKLQLHIQRRDKSMVFFEVYCYNYAFNSVAIEWRNAIIQWSLLCSIFRNLQVLDLDSCNFDENTIKLLCNSMSQYPGMSQTMFKLQSLSCSFMTNFGDGTLFHTFFQLPQLKYVNLYGTNLSKVIIESLCCVLKCPTCRVEKLLLGKCNISSSACGIIATSLLHCKVKHLSLVENPLKTKGVKLLCEILRHPNCLLETLMLSYCCITFSACGHLCEALLYNKYLSLLDLGSNFLTDFGVNILCKALKNSKCPLQELWLSGCYLTSDCCEEISNVLNCNKNLKTLKLGNNNIKDMGVKLLCEALKNPDCKLQCLGLDMCEFTSNCCEDLASALTTCKTLTSLNLDCITLDHHGLQLLCEAFNHKHCNLKVLGMDRSAYSKKSQMLLQTVEKKNKLNILHYPWVEEERNKRGVRLVWNSRN
ncbi:NACHT, LRR and PYD domains-containing protein 9B-like isoform X1 [Sigmodon hispidus]